MVSKVGIIGLGNVGSAVALALVLRGSVSELVLIDKDDKKARAEQYDLTDQQALLTSNTKILRQNYNDSWTLLKDCDVLVFSPGDISILQAQLQTDNPDRLNELRSSAQIVQEVAPKINASKFNGIILSITNPCDVVVTYLQELVDLPKNHIFGTGTTLDTTRMKHAVSAYLDCSIHDIDGYVLGEHGESQFTAWSTVRVGGIPMNDLAATHRIDLKVIEENSSKGAWYIISGKGFTSHGIGLTGATLVEAILNNARQVFPLSSYNTDYQTYIGQPTRIGAGGVLEVLPLTLSDTEQELFDHSAKIVRENRLKIPSLLAVDPVL
ncbi:L-lactate dehydrogenase [Agrilactobacillus yilanensis]|uniref:L-lactate dehydrogenase n=1 Tax=Agrilactobacillus yilanensis TaxID=2485997 RepID=A0ABW4J8Q4_9LACO|nr:L-lactate dehydrogenase [Agrilactobacillus yilanensis]